MHFAAMQSDDEKLQVMIARVSLMSPHPMPEIPLANCPYSRKPLP